MDVRITNVYNDKALPNKGLEIGHGQSFHITMGPEQILFDVGWKGKILLHNLSSLKIGANEIDKLVFSHGHRDHTGALPSFLRARTVATPIDAFGHPDVSEPKSVKRRFLRLPFGLPKLSGENAKKINFRWTKEPVEIAPKLFTTGEIRDRPEPEGREKRGLHKSNGRWEWDRVIDDMSLIFQTKDGLVILTGCCHAGVLNTCARATALFSGNIKAIIGGTHLKNLTNEEVHHVGQILKNKYGTPELYLNHCTGGTQMGQLRGELGSEKVHDCHAGTELSFQC
jgi:7,8-dihydropterin-6-yl-methyl-4-(beta-D-ribofuranosyl)aminobenzene 5'-phosphate synthase